MREAVFCSTGGLRLANKKKVLIIQDTHSFAYSLICCDFRLLRTIVRIYRTLVFITLLCFHVCSLHFPHSISWSLTTISETLREDWH